MYIIDIYASTQIGDGWFQGCYCRETKTMLWEGVVGEASYLPARVGPAGPVEKGEWQSNKEHLGKGPNHRSTCLGTPQGSAMTGAEASEERNKKE